MPFLARKAFISGAAALAATAPRRGAWAAEQRVNDVLVEDGRWLLPGWESLTDPDDAGVAKTLDLVSETAKILAGKGIGLLLAVIPFKARYCAELAAGSFAPTVVTRYARALDAMQARGLKTADLEAAMRPLQTAGGPAYYPTDQHWRWAAIDLAGDAGPYHALLMNLRSTLPKRAPAVVVWQMSEGYVHLGPGATGWWNITSLMSPDFFLSHVEAAVSA